MGKQSDKEWLDMNKTSVERKGGLRDKAAVGRACHLLRTLVAGACVFPFRGGHDSFVLLSRCPIEGIFVAFLLESG